MKGLRESEIVPGALILVFSGVHYPANLSLVTEKTRVTLIEGYPKLKRKTASRRKRNVVQLNPVKTDTSGTIERVRFRGVCLLSG